MKNTLVIIVIVLVLLGLAVWLGLPAELKAMGLHPPYRGPKVQFHGGKALIITTSHDRLGENGSKTGVFGSEMTAPYYEFSDGGMNVDLASIKGGPIPIDPMSFKWFIKSEYDDRYLKDPEFQRKANHSLRIDDIDFTNHDIIYLAGGWGAACDLGTSQVLGRKISQAFGAGKVIGGVCQDWGGLIGLRLLAAQPERFARAVVANTGLPTGDLPITEAFLQWRQFSLEVPEFSVGAIINMGTLSSLSEEILEAYNAPFPDETYKEGARIFPSLVPISPDDPAAPANRQAWEALSRFEKPFLTAFSDGDPITRGGEQIFKKRVRGAKGQPHTVIRGGGHFLQEDRGEEFAQVVIDFMTKTAV